MPVCGRTQGPWAGGGPGAPAAAGQGGRVAVCRKDFLSTCWGPRSRWTPPGLAQPLPAGHEGREDTAWWGGLW